MRRRSGVKVAVLQEMKAAGVRTYILEKKQVGKRNWVGKEEERNVVRANRQRLQRFTPLSHLRPCANPGRLEIPEPGLLERQGT